MVKEKCPSCSAPLEPGAKFCWRCGAKLEPSKGRSKSISNQKERTSILELNDVKKQLDELKKYMDERITRLENRLKEISEARQIPGPESMKQVPPSIQPQQESPEDILNKYKLPKWDIKTVSETDIEWRLGRFAKEIKRKYDVNKLKEVIELARRKGMHATEYAAFLRAGLEDEAIEKDGRFFAVVKPELGQYTEEEYEISTYGIEPEE